MKLLRGPNHIPNFNHGVVATVGNFDGIHLGHQHLIAALRVEANRLNLPLVLILFEPQPGEFFQKDKAPARLTSLREKLDILKRCGVDYVYCIKFDEQLAQTPAKEFAYQHLLSALSVKYLLVGEDFRFGRNREGDVALLTSIGAEHGCEVAGFVDFTLNNERVSSTKIRAALQQGSLGLAAHYLGRTFSLCGRVIKGDGRGRQWGFPTANLGLHRLSLPLHGVFVIEAEIGTQRVKGVANLGKRPTVDGTKNILEVHLFDFDQPIYGRLMQVFFLHKLRDEVKFTSVDALIAQIHQDAAAAKAFFLEYNEHQVTMIG